ncbi:MAG: hypothetical protein KBG30_11740 [Bacteroidales bacterium]|jgi:hypothetical protein|nr:hypothetical protein [Bacteroidales bacterium]
MAKRFQTYFGVPIPPQRRKKLGAGTTTIRFVVTGNIPAKKNQQQAVAIRKPARDWANKQSKLRQPTWADVHKAISMCSSKMRGNAKYHEFVKYNKPKLISQMQVWSERLSAKGLTFPLPSATFSVRFCWKDRYIRDTINAEQSILDLLVESGVIMDDNYFRLNPRYSESECHLDEVIYNIAFISLSFKL